MVIDCDLTDLNAPIVIVRAARGAEKVVHRPPREVVYIKALRQAAKANTL